MIINHSELNCTLSEFSYKGAPFTGISIIDKQGFCQVRIGDIIYFKNGLIHREDGPAIIRLNGKNDYYINNIFLKFNIKIYKKSKLEFNYLVKI